jgi:hypothetical protein
VKAATRPNLERADDVVLKGIPVWMLRGIDLAAARTGTDRQSIIIIWLAERLEQETAPGLRMAGAGA